MYRDALNEAIEEEMAARPDGLHHRRGHCRAGRLLQGHRRPAGEVRPAAGARHAHCRSRASPAWASGPPSPAPGPSWRSSMSISPCSAWTMLVNQAAKFRLMTGGEGRVPLVMRTQGGTGRRRCRAAFAEPGSAVLSHPGPQGGDALRPRRREGPAEICAPPGTTR